MPELGKGDLKKKKKEKIKQESYKTSPVSGRSPCIMICFHFWCLAPVCLKSLGKDTVQYCTSQLENLLLQLGFITKLKNYKIMPLFLTLFDRCSCNRHVGCYTCHVLHNNRYGFCVCVCLFFKEKDIPNRPLRVRTQSPDGRLSFRWKPPYGAGFRGPRSRSQGYLRGSGESSRRMSYAPLLQERQNQEARKLGESDFPDSI